MSVVKSSIKVAQFRNTQRGIEGKHCYEVLQTVNTIACSVGAILTEKEVNEFIVSGVTVTVVSSKK